MVKAYWAIMQEYLSDNFSLKELSILLAFIQLCSFSSVAEKLNIEPYTVKRIIKKIEQGFGFPIYILQNNKEIVITKEGQAQLPWLIDFLQNAQKIFAIDKPLSIFASVFISHLMVKHCFQALADDKVVLSTYSLGRARDYGLLTKQMINTYDVVHLNQQYEHLIDPNLWVCKFRYTTQVKLYATPEYLRAFPDIKTPEDLRQHQCLSFRRQDENVWTFYDRNNQIHQVRIDSRVIIDTTFIQYFAVEEGFGIAKLEQPVVEYFNRHDLVTVLPEYRLDNQDWAVYVRNDCKHKAVKRFIDTFKQMVDDKF
ncbi:LysR family transcriptional regulator [Facilibium subflavum]|uniref:LysR family transcriptional regulator n=1 Tax=Facilibium subflavum TaxID=2219058 RepID=UPI000E65C9EC|nr:LysR substrate-binding domain-containing protein [Facilibium subflavum]